MQISEQIQDLESKFNVVSIIDLNNYDLESIVDLYVQIKKVHRDTYESNDRLIFLFTQDFYKKDFAPGLMLKSLQAIVNDIDISNYFVCIITTNSQIQDEYQYVQDNISTDTVPFHIYKCTGPYQQLEYNGNQSGYTKIQKISNIDQFDSLPDEKKNLVTKNDSFCMMPWTALMINTNSQVKLCCESKEIIGDCSKDSLETIWNSDSLRQIRKDMLAGHKIKTCESCYVKEGLGRDTLRKSTNRRFIHKINKIDLTQQDGSVSQFELNYLDARYNNLCNLSCRSCGPWASSSWHQPAVAIGQISPSSQALLVAGKNQNDIFNQITQHIDSLETIYFAGGEPTMIKEFYHLVDALDQRGRHDVELIYNINMTRSSLTGKSIFDAWKNFKRISVGASLDGECERGEYLRCGQKWSDVLKLRKDMLAQRPDIDFYISATTSIINALHLPDFHRNWVELGLIEPGDFNIQMLFGPKYLRVDHAPAYLKNLIRSRYLEHLDWLRPKDTLGRAVYGFESILNYLDNDFEFDPKDFWNNITPLDQYYGQDLVTVFPELSDLPRS